MKCTLDCNNVKKSFRDVLIQIDSEYYVRTCKADEAKQNSILINDDWISLFLRLDAFNSQYTCFAVT